MKHRHLSTLFIGLLTITLSILSVIHVEAAKDCHSGSFGYGYSNCEVVTSFNDTAEHTYNKAILYAQEREIVKGYDDGTFKPDNPVNRAEFTKIIVEA
ncbi:MAG: S-layer homology domain-containing protein, partial [Candidatus Gracilibacteria bacterium]|nr:S-layer homology domain-containing protein [Candidatus Gracilibacteria bacterium]